jgi:muramoyltetrapeptide carboxypeptidase
MPKQTLHLRVVAPGSMPRRNEVEAAAAALGNAGHRVSLGQHVFSSHRYLAGRLPQRLADLIGAFEDPSVDAVWCARGGYGSSELLPHLETIAANKPIIGYSDNTSLLGLIASRGGVALHAPVFEELLEPAGAAPHRCLRSDARRVLQLLQATDPDGLRDADFELTPASPLADRAVSGPVWGGNLTTLASLAGTPWAASFRGGLVLLEDVGEPYYRIERLLLQLKQSDALTDTAAVVLGDFHNCPQRGVPGSIADIFVEHLSPVGVPVFCGAPFGHGARNHPWQLGRRATIRHGRFSWND